MELERLVTIMRTLEGGHGVDIGILEHGDYRRLVQKYGDDSLCLCMMGDHVALRLKLTK